MLITDLELFQLGCCAAFLASVVAALLLTPAARALALRLGVVDHSDGQRKLHQRSVPLLGGVALWLAIALGAGLASALLGGAAILLPLALSGGLVCAVGVVDDAWTLQPRWKLLGQIVATWPIVVSGLAVPAVSMGGLEIGLGWWSAPFTVVWFVAGINAFNFIDGVDGLASTIGLIATAALSVVAIMTGNTATLPILLAVGGALCGFLIYNLPPARIYLGDAGSMLIGLTISALATLTTRTDAGAVPLIPLALLMVVPLADMTLAVMRRIQTGVFFWRADRQHIHHRLLEHGFSPRKVLAFIALLGAIMATLGVVALVTGREAWPLAAAATLAALLVQGRYLGHYEWSLVKRSAALAVFAVSARWWARRFRDELPSPADLITSSVDDNWNRFVTAVSMLSRARIDVTAGSGSSIHWRRDLTMSGESDDAADTCMLRFRSESADAGWCVARIHVLDASRMNPSHWLSLIAAVEHFCRHWAAQEEQSSGVSAPDRDAVILRHPAA